MLRMRDCWPLEELLNPAGVTLLTLAVAMVPSFAMAANWSVPAAGSYRAEITLAAPVQTAEEEVVWLGSSAGIERINELSQAGWQCANRGQMASCRRWTQSPLSREALERLSQQLEAEGELTLTNTGGSAEQISFGEVVQEWRLPLEARLSGASSRMFNTVRLYDFGTWQRIDLGQRGEMGPGFTPGTDASGHPELRRLFSFRIETSRWTADIFTIEVPYRLQFQAP